MCPKDIDRIANSVNSDQTAHVNPDQTAPLGAVWSGSTLFAQTYLSEQYGIHFVIVKDRLVFFFFNK